MLPVQRDAGSIPGQGAKIPRAIWQKKKNVTVEGRVGIRTQVCHSPSAGLTLILKVI